MKFLGAEQILNQTMYKELNYGTMRGLLVRYTGTNASGVAVTLAQLGQVRVNFRGNDNVNDTVSFFASMNNLYYGVAEFSSTTSGAYAATIWIPFSAPWDEKNGMFNSKGIAGFIQTNNALTTAVVANGVIEVYYLEAEAIANYATFWLQQNVQVGGAGQAKQTLTGFDVSSLLLEENAQITLIQVNKDERNLMSSTQAVEKAASNLMNRVETAITLIELNINPYKYIPAGGRQVTIQLQMGAATTVGLHTLGFSNTPEEATRSIDFYGSRLPVLRAATPSANSDTQ